MAHKCRYCSKKIPENEDYCSNECKLKTEKFYAYEKRFVALMLVLVAFFIIVIFVQSFFFKNEIFIIFLALIGLGITGFIFPFGNSDDWIGIKRSIVIIRVAAVIMILMGIIVLILPSFHWPS